MTDATTPEQPRTAIDFARCPVCGNSSLMRLPDDWQAQVDAGRSIPIIACGNPWHYDAIEAQARPAAASEGLRAAAHSQLTVLLKIVRAAQNTYVGRHWPDKAAMRRDGIGFGLNDGEHEDRIRRFLYECQPEFLMQYLETAIAALASDAGSVRALDVERLANVLRYSPMHWEVRRPDGAFVMTRMFDSPEEAAAAIVAAYDAERQGDG